jgi:hypothetical protein
MERIVKIDKSVLDGSAALPLEDAQLLTRSILAWMSGARNIMALSVVASFPPSDTH